MTSSVVLTAGHCVFLHENGGWARSIEVNPGSDGTARPFGSYRSRTFRSIEAWVTDKDERRDYGTIILAAPLPAILKPFQPVALDDQQLAHGPVTVSGYPSDKPSFEEWEQTGDMVAADRYRLEYDIDTVGGQSGSPVWRFGSDGTALAVGVHTTGGIPSVNVGVRLTEAVLENIELWTG